MMSEPGKRSNPLRMVLVIGGTFLWGGILLVRLGQLQVVQHEKYAEQALRRQQVTRSVMAPRGVIYDSHMDELAATVRVYSVYAEPQRISDVTSAARKLASILDLDFEELLAKMNDPGRSHVMAVKRRINPEDESHIEALGIHGVYMTEESMRVYPNLDLACHTLGFVNMDGDGGAGIEYQYDKILRGTQGQISFDVDGHRRPFWGTVMKPPTQGHSLILSIDKSIQYIAERELATGIKDSRAIAGTVVVMDSETGRILALAGLPGFNCNAYNEYPLEYHRNRAITDMFEPGSTFKVVVASAALEAGLTRPGELIDCQMGTMPVASHVFHDHKPYDLLTFGQILEYSSNIGAAKLGMRLGNQRLYESLRSFGFGSKTGIELPGEIAGLVHPWKRWSGLSVPAISFGQEVGVTSMQMLVAINAIANGGMRVRPSVVDRILDENGNLAQLNEPERTRIMKPGTAAAVQEAFEGVVLRGTGQQAALDGYRAAGKTGTAQKSIDGRYSSTKYVASFIGFAPLPQPRITVLVQLDEPKSAIFGGEVAAPIFRRVTQEALLQLHVPPDPTVPTKRTIDSAQHIESSEDFRPDATPVLPIAGGEEAEGDHAGDGIITVNAVEASVEIPDFKGMSKRRVMERCQELGLRIQTFGTGVAVFQLPPPGTLLAVGDTCSVTFGLARHDTGRALPERQNSAPYPAGVRRGSEKR